MTRPTRPVACKEKMLCSPRPRLSVQAGLKAAILITALAFFAKSSLQVGGILVPWSVFAVTSGVAIAIGGVLTAFYVEFTLAHRMERVVRVLERASAGRRPDTASGSRR